MGDLFLYQLAYYLFSLAILITIYISIKKLGDSQTKVNGFLKLVVLSGLLIITEIIWSSIGTLTIVPIFVKYIINIAFFVIDAFIGFYYFLFIEVLIGTGTKNLKKKILIATIPLAINIVFIITTPLTHLLFYINEAGEYVRGSLKLIETILVYILPIIGIVESVVRGIKAKTRIERNSYLNVSKYVIFPLFFGILDYLNPSISVYTLGVVSALLSVFIDFQNTSISNDPLTGLNNRMQLDVYLTELIQEKKVENKIFVAMMDVDNFKSINDKHGHLEGDKALLIIAETLKQVCGKYDKCFLARYGGDEFTIVLVTEDETALEKICNEINELLYKKTVNYKLDYELYISYGISKRIYGQTELEVVALADRILYENKANRKKQKAIENRD